jgi:hypothetical protein
MRRGVGVRHDGPVSTEGPSGAELVEASYDAFASVLREVDDDGSWAPTGCRGWAVRDLAHHHLLDAQRALVALHSPADAEPDRDAVSYWRDWAPDPTGAAHHRRYVRVVASMFLHWAQLRELHAETSAAVVEAARSVSATSRVRTQGHVLAADDLLRTLCVEATIHHLDVTTDLPGAPAPSRAGLAEVRRVLDGLAGKATAESWPDERYARVATGRAAPDDQERRDLGALVDRLPLFS